MRITDLLKPEGIKLGAEIGSKSEAIDSMVALMELSGNLNDTEAYRRAVQDREAEGSTGIGEGVAIPHAKTAAVKRAGLCAMVVKDGVDYDSLDGQPAYLFFMIAAPDTAADLHLEVLGRLSVMLMDEEFRQKLIQAGSTKEFLSLIDGAEEQKVEAEKERAESREVPDSEKGSKAAGQSYRVLAVTACPTGIAHTFMAAESLEQKARELGVGIKVETNGSAGASNVLTAAEIAAADCIIIAADKKVEMERFKGKRVIQTKVSDGIHKPEALIQDAISGKAQVYQGEGGGSSAEREIAEKQSAGHMIYTHLMNGVSHMLPFVIGGGILIAISFLLDNYSIDPSNFGSNLPTAAFFNQVGNAAFSFMLPVLAGYIAMSIADRPGLAVGFVGGALAIAGNSGFLGALLAGFIAGYVVLLLKKVFKKLPPSLEGIKPVLLYPLFGVLLIGVIIVFIVNPPVGALNMWITDVLNTMGETSKVLLGVVLAGMMAIDMGGPFNKAAYVFGTASLAAGQYDFMAAVMIGGMAPPLAIALCTTFFKKKFTAKERQSGIANYIMGLSFITEGAIPFAASDPLRVIPSCVLGSAVAGGLTMFFNCTLMAPHGGIFVVPVIGHPAGFLIALAVGSLVSMTALALLKKNVITEV